MHYSTHHDVLCITLHDILVHHQEGVLNHPIAPKHDNPRKEQNNCFVETYVPTTMHTCIIEASQMSHCDSHIIPWIMGTNGMHRV